MQGVHRNDKRGRTTAHISCQLPSAFPQPAQELTCTETCHEGRSCYLIRGRDHWSLRQASCKSARKADLPSVGPWGYLQFWTATWESDLRKQVKGQTPKKCRVPLLPGMPYLMFHRSSFITPLFLKAADETPGLADTEGSCTASPETPAVWTKEQYFQGCRNPDSTCACRDLGQFFRPALPCFPLATRSATGFAVSSGGKNPHGRFLLEVSNPVNHEGTSTRPPSGLGVFLKLEKWHKDVGTTASRLKCYFFPIPYLKMVHILENYNISSQYSLWYGASSHLPEDIKEEVGASTSLSAQHQEGNTSHRALLRDTKNHKCQRSAYNIIFNISYCFFSHTYGIKKRLQLWQYSKLFALTNALLDIFSYYFCPGSTKSPQSAKPPY